MCDMERKKKKELSDYLRRELDRLYSWIYRKEIAAWASVVLYFAIFFGISTIAKDSDLNFGYSMVLVIFVILFSYLFLLFLFKQYGSLAEGMFRIQVISYWIKKIMQDENFDYSSVFNHLEDNTIPDNIRPLLKKHYGLIRKRKMPGKLFIPFCFLYYKLIGKHELIGKDKYHNLEVQESALYDIVILSTFLLIAYIIL